MVDAPSTLDPPGPPPAQTSGAQASEQRSHEPFEPAAILTLVLLCATWAWWAWQKGAYFGVVLLPGAILLCLVAALLTRFAPWRGQLALSRPVILALCGLTALGLWALLSALWSPAPDVAIGDGQRILVYALSFALGLALCNLLGPRMNLSLLPLTVAAAFAGIAAVIMLSTGHHPIDVLEIDGTLDYPLGYRNAEAAFFGIALFPAIGLAASGELDWRLRAGALATATLCIDVFLLAQSRASAPAMLVGLVVYTMLSPLRVRAVAWLGLALLPALAIFPAEVSLFHASADGVGGAVSEMHRAGIVAAVTTALSLLLGGLASRHESRLPGLRSRSADANRRVSLALVALAVVAVVGFVAAVGNPVSWLGDRADEFKSAGTPDLSSHASRFTFNAGSNRYDAWRVALGDVGDDPLFGDGGGGYQYSYLRNRDNGHQYLHDAHSVELELLSELGIVGLALFAVAAFGAGAGALRSRRLGPSAATLTAIALSSGAYWLVHTSLDWFWPYPAVTAPVIALLGSAGAPAIRSLGRRSTRNWRRWATAGLAVLAVSAVPFWLSERFVDNAYGEWRDDLHRAYSDLDRARSLDPFSDMTLLAEASIATAVGDRERSLSALREAADVRPEEWATHYLLAKGQLHSNPRLARNEIRVALELNPLSVDVRALARRLDVDPETGAATNARG